LECSRSGKTNNFASPPSPEREKKHAWGGPGKKAVFANPFHRISINPEKKGGIEPERGGKETKRQNELKEKGGGGGQNYLVGLAGGEKESVIQAEGEGDKL